MGWNLLAAIRKIEGDATLSDQEKARRRQELLGSKATTTSAGCGPKVSSLAPYSSPPTSSSPAPGGTAINVSLGAPSCTSSKSSLPPLGTQLLTAAVLYEDCPEHARIPHTAQFPCLDRAAVMVGDDEAFLLVSAGEAFVYTGQLDFFITRLPKGMKTMNTGLFLSFFLSSMLVTLMKGATKWLGDTINHSHLNYPPPPPPPPPRLCQVEANRSPVD